MKNNYPKEMLKSVGMIYECAPLYTVLKLLIKFFLAVMVPFQLIVVQQVINAVTDVLGGGSSQAYLWCGIFLGLDLLLILLTYFDSVVQFKINELVNKRITYSIVKKFCSVEYYCLEDAGMSDMVNLMSREPDAKLVEQFEYAVNSFSCLVMLAGDILYLAQVSYGFMLGFALMLILTVFYNYKGMAMMTDVIMEQSSDERKLQYMSDMLSDKSMLYELKVYKGVDYIVRKWKKEAKRIFGVRLKTIIRAQRYFILTTVLFILWTAVTAAVFAALVIGHRISLGLFSSFILSLASIMNSTEEFSDALAMFGKRGIEQLQFQRFMELPDAKAGSRRLEAERYHIVFQNVSFSYPGTGRQILKNVSFVFESGESVALVGENGAGKSTLVKLLLGLYEPDAGTIWVNGHRLQELDGESKRRLFGVIFQDYTKYFLTLRENVAFGNMKCLQDDEKIYRALCDGMAQDIPGLGEKRLDMHLGKLEQDGVDLSGGQWQRVALSRALISDAAFVILDEPTAAMDPVAESRMYEAFLEVMRERGSIMISHRLASAKAADRIIVLRDGRICETGTHESLMERQGLYCEMYRQQSAWYQKDGGKVGEPK